MPTARARIRYDRTDEHKQSQISGTPSPHEWFLIERRIGTMPRLTFRRIIALPDGNKVTDEFDVSRVVFISASYTIDALVEFFVSLSKHARDSVRSNSNCCWVCLLAIRYGMAENIRGMVDTSESGFVSGREIGLSCHGTVLSARFFQTSSNGQESMSGWTSLNPH